MSGKWIDGRRGAAWLVLLAAVCAALLAWGVGGLSSEHAGSASVPARNSALRATPMDEPSFGERVTTLAPEAGRRGVERVEVLEEEFPPPPSPGPEVVGRVIDRETGAGLEGVNVGIQRGSLHDDGSLRWSVTDAAGEFRFAVAEGVDAITVHPPKGWRSDQESLRCTGRAWAGCAPPVFELSRLAAGPVQALVVDRHTGEPVPDATLALGGRNRELVTTDGDGRFTSVREFGHEQLSVQFQSDPDTPKRSLSIEHADTAGFARIPVEVGPTYRIAFALPGGLSVSDFRGYLRRSSDDPGMPALLFTGAVRDGAPAWVRLPQPFSPAGSAELCLFSTRDRCSAALPSSARGASTPQRTASSWHRRPGCA